jgi:hypothetical protein
MGLTGRTSITASGHTRTHNAVGVSFLVAISPCPSGLTHSYNVRITTDRVATHQFYEYIESRAEVVTTAA